MFYLATEYDILKLTIYLKEILNVKSIYDRFRQPKKGKEYKLINDHITVIGQDNTINILNQASKKKNIKFNEIEELFKNKVNEICD